MSHVIKYPDPLLEVRVQFLDAPMATTALCAGFQGGEWRGTQLADHMFQWLPFAALNQEHQLSFAAHNFVEMLKLAAAHIYHTKKTASRGELGELLLHLACISHFKTVPVLCKLLLKTSPNDTVKGFDGVHLLPTDNAFELWLGEAKFYTDAADALRDAADSIKSHYLPAFLQTEKAMIFGHIAEGIPHRERVLNLFRQQTSSDELLKMSVFPVLLTYESATISTHGEITDNFVSQLSVEVERIRASFGNLTQGMPLRFQLILVPMKSKRLVVESFDQKLVPFL